MTKAKKVLKYKFGEYKERTEKYLVMKVQVEDFTASNLNKFLKLKTKNTFPTTEGIRAEIYDHSVLFWLVFHWHLNKVDHSYNTHSFSTLHYNNF